MRMKVCAETQSDHKCQDNARTSEMTDKAELSIYNVLTASLFILFASGLSYCLGLELEQTALVAAARCWIQLSLFGYILKDVFEASNPWLVALMTITLTLLGGFEAAFNRNKRSFKGNFGIVVASLGISLCVGLLGVKVAVTTTKDKAWWDPATLIPIEGILLGNAVSGVTVGIEHVLNQVLNNQDKIEMYLSFGATRYEAMQPIMIEAVRIAVLPCINQISIVGLVSIPGLMAGSILGGASVTQAARYQEIILFLICASNLTSVFTSVFMTTFLVCIDSSHRLRTDRIKVKRPFNVKALSQWMHPRT